MSTFFIFAFLLAALVLLIVTYAIPKNKILVSAITSSLILFVAFLYLHVGAYSQLPLWFEKQTEIAKTNEIIDDINQRPHVVIERIKSRLENEPNSIEGWYLLARLYASVGEETLAEQAFEKAKTLYELKLSQSEIKINLSISPGLITQIDPTTQVFVFAKDNKGSPMPLAVSKLQVKDLPKQIILNDAMAMTSEHKISDVDEIRIGARVSFSGTPLAEKGDLQAKEKVIKLSEFSGVLSLTIDEVLG